LATSSQAEDVTGWLPYQGNMVDLAMANTNDPVYGTNAPNNIDNSGIYGSLQTPISLNPSEEAVLRSLLDAACAVSGAQPIGKLSGACDVGEEDGDRTGWKFGHRRCLRHPYDAVKARATRA
jgi:hypothetical protein